jgi:MFS family permease
LVEATPSQRLALLLDESPAKTLQRWLWVLSTGGTLLDGFAIFALGVAMPLVIAQFHLTPDIVGLIGAALVFGAVLGAGIGGPAADGLGRKGLMLTDMLIIAAGAATSALATGPAMLFAGQLFVGVGIGIADAAAQSKALGIAILFSRPYRARTVLVAVPWFLMDIAKYGVGLFTPIILGAIIGKCYFFQERRLWKYRND